MDTLHKQVLTLLGFDIVWGNDKSFTPDHLYPVSKCWLLRRNGYDESTHDTEADAWAQAPTLEALMSPLRRLMATEMTLVTDCHPSGKWFVGLSSWQGGANGTKMILFEADLAESHEDEATAIAMLFIAACNAGHIDPSKVVLK